MIGFWIFMLLVNLLSPIVMIVFGNLFVKNTPQDINYVYGVRTEMSMKNMDTWEFAHKYCGKLLAKFGLVTLLVSALAMIFVFGKSINIIAIVGVTICLLQIVPLIIAVVSTNKALKQNFDQNGIRKTA